MSARCGSPSFWIGLIYVLFAFDTAKQVDEFVRERCGHRASAAVAGLVAVVWPVLPAIAFAGRLLDTPRPSTAEFCEAAR